VGVCTAGDYITLQCNGDPSQGVVRICEGHTGCNHGSVTKIRALADMCGVNDQIVFQCPDDGSYAVMAGPEQSGDPVALKLLASTGQFPASELVVFDRREGAYFGSMLDPNEYSPMVSASVNAAGVVVYDVPNLPTGMVVVNESMYACHDMDWDDAAAYATDRLCARVMDSNNETATLCAANPLGACYGPAGSICAVDDTGMDGDGDFDACTGDGALWGNPITVFLDHPCDLAGPGIEEDDCPGQEPWPL
jgi:hypothetical protein